MSNAPPPTSVPPVPPTNGGNRTYAILAVLLLLGMGALLYFKFKGEDPPEVAKAVPSAAPTFRQQEDDIPPPPEPLPEAGPPDAGSTQKVASAGGGGCSAQACSEAPAAITNALALRGRQARRCYESQLANDPSLHVKTSINVKVGTNGSVCSASVTETTNDAVSKCALNFFRQGSYPVTPGCIANVTVPLNFVPR